MCLSMQKFLVSISIALLSLLVLPLQAQQERHFPDSAGSKVKYNATIEMSKGYVSGVCIMANDGSVIKGSLFNEFGISAIDFTYQPDKKKVKLLSVIKILNKWYIKKVLRKDLVQVMENLSKGIYSYHDKKFKIDYNFLYLNKIVQPQWLEWAKELQFIAQGGLTYSKDVFDIERFERIREIAAEMLSLQSGIPIEKVKNLFCNETGFQTPKLDTRAAIFKDDKILLVKEKNGTWSLPGGWVDINQSIKTNTEKEVKEEAGLNVKAIRVIAIQDRNLHNIPPYAYNVCKVFVLCEIESGSFRANIETDESGYFGLEALPVLAKEKNNEEQIKMCFSAYHDKNWQVLFD